jgi:hypothetical protein
MMARRMPIRSFTMDDETYAQIKFVGTQRDLSRSAALRLLVMAGFEKVRMLEPITS